MATLREHDVHYKKSVLTLDEKELAVIRELITKAHDEGTNWASYADAVVIGNLDQVLNGS